MKLFHLIFVLFLFAFSSLTAQSKKALVDKAVKQYVSYYGHKVTSSFVFHKVDWNVFKKHTNSSNYSAKTKKAIISIGQKAISTEHYTFVQVKGLRDKDKDQNCILYVIHWWEEAKDKKPNTFVIDFLKNPGKDDHTNSAVDKILCKRERCSALDGECASVTVLCTLKDDCSDCKGKNDDLKSISNAYASFIGMDF